MRITNQMFYSNMNYQYKNSMNGLFGATKQLSSGLKIQYGYEDASAFVDTMRLDYNITTLEQVQKSSSKAQTFANNSDKILNQVTDSFATFKTKLIQAANSGVSSATSMEALANDLEAIRSSMIDQVNTSINGQFLFSGTALTKKPMDDLGNYHGNNETISSVVGSKVTMPYNLPGYDLMLGRDGDYHDIQQTNVRLVKQTEPDKGMPIKEDSSIKQLVGEFKGGDTTFYLQGRNTAGEGFRTKFKISPDSTMNDLLKKIGEEYGNTENNELVDVTMNKDGHIMIKDNRKGNSVLEFNLIAATDKTATKGDAGKSDTNTPETLFNDKDIQITEFIKTYQLDKDGNKLNPFSYDKAQFDKNGKSIRGSVSQVVQATNEFATESTKLSEVTATPLYIKDANGKPKLNPKASLIGETFTLNIKNISGDTKKVDLAFNADNSTFTIDGNTYEILDAKGKKTPANELTYRQLNDVISMTTSEQLPNSLNNPTDYNKAINLAKEQVEVNLDYRGRIEAIDRRNSVSKIEITLNNTNSGDFSKTSKLSFAANEALVVDEPYVDIFKDMDEMIKAVRGQLAEADGDFVENPKNPGIEAAIKRLDHLSDHVVKRHAKIGSLSNALKSASERSELLGLNIKKIQSEIIDTDYGEAYMKLNQNSMSYQALLQATAKINSLSLLNYM